LLQKLWRWVPDDATAKASASTAVASSCAAAAAIPGCATTATGGHQHNIGMSLRLQCWIQRMANAMGERMDWW